MRVETPSERIIPPNPGRRAGQMSGVMGDSSDFTAESVVHAMQLAGDALRLSTATPDQLNPVAAFLAKVVARFPEGTSPDPRGVDAIGRLEVAGKAVGAELRRRAFA
jgi:hypothetical protein